MYYRNSTQVCHDQRQLQFAIVNFKILIPCSKQQVILANMPLAEPQTWNAYKTEQKPQTLEVPFYGRRGRRGSKENCNADEKTRFWPSVASRAPLQRNKRNNCGWFAQTPPPPNCSQNFLFVESTLVAVQVPGSGAHGLAIFGTTIQALNF